MSSIVDNIYEMAAVKSGEIELKAETSTETLNALRPQVKLPCMGRSISEFAVEAGAIMAPKKVWFAKGDQVIDVREEKLAEKVKSLVFHILSPTEARTALEDHVETGNWHELEGGGTRFFAQSMGRELAAALLASPQFKRTLPRIDRILDIPIPVFLEGKLTFAKTGYDERLNTFCPVNAPEINPMPLDDAKQWLLELQKDFCFANPLSVTLSTARLLTPMCRGLMGFNARPPVWLFEGNRPRAGKDYLANCTTVLYEGRPNEDAPLDDEPDETRKRITAALQSGRRFMHFANCTGYAHNSAFEHATTAKIYSARMLGHNDAAADITLPNEIEYSLSGNTGFSFTEDFNLRCRKISLHYSEEDANSRIFTHPDLHGWILEHRSELLSALAGLIAYWDQQGRPKGPTPFSSFPEWAAVVGGIMTCCGLGDPCQPQLDATLTADNLTEDMKKLFSLGFQWHPDEWLDKNQVKNLVTDNPDIHLFGWMDLEERSGQTTFGLRLRGFEGRILEGIQLVANYQDKRRPKYKFTRHLQPTNHALAQEVFGATTEAECAPCQPCQPFTPHSVLEDKYSLCGRGEKAPKVHKVDISGLRESEIAPVLPSCEKNTPLGGLNQASSITGNGTGQPIPHSTHTATSSGGGTKPLTLAEAQSFIGTRTNGDISSESPDGHRSG